MKGLTEGRIVHYVVHSGEHVAAIVTHVKNRDFNDNKGIVDLTLFLSPRHVYCGVHHAIPVPLLDIPYEDNFKGPGSWHWIEPA
jgi:hypothetical protein